MAVEIKELVIRAVVHRDPSRSTAATDPDPAEERIIEACVEQVLQILRRERER